MKRVAVGLSGGIDSGTTALLLKEQGYDVFGVTMWIFDHQANELEAAKRVADAIGIKHYVLDYRAAFESLIIGTFIKEYEQGLTPNPCILCNKTFKYGQLIADCVRLGADYFATGHYAKVDFNRNLGPEGEFLVQRADNRRKDQSYNLYHLDQDTLKRLIFPLGTVKSKDDVRKRFAALHVELSEKKDSLGICFIEHKNHVAFLRERDSKAMRRGTFVSKENQILGYHDGTARFTTGQKRRLGQDLNGQYLNGKYVVVSMDPEKSEVVLGTESDLLYDVVRCAAFNVISPQLESHLLTSNANSVDVDVVLSQWSTVYKGRLKLERQSGTNDRIAHVVFERPVRAPARGQALVCYKDDVLVGGGIIFDYK
ncbi:MAG TPA: tRNA 2-thiouridine(34) synthase MnmA [Clostridiales bacterium UBA8960]|nr:tRNA 2-thiouridine(34) synthase MnmA [Clostridiales bacterium UBA8960]